MGWFGPCSRRSLLSEYKLETFYLPVVYKHEQFTMTNLIKGKRTTFTGEMLTRITAGRS